MKKIFLAPTVLAILAVTLWVAGCGKKGDPLPPAGSTYTYPGPYPAQ